MAMDARGGELYSCSNFELRLYRKAINSCRENGCWKACTEILRFLRHLHGQGRVTNHLIHLKMDR